MAKKKEKEEQKRKLFKQLKIDALEMKKNKSPQEEAVLKLLKEKHSK